MSKSSWMTALASVLLSLLAACSGSPSGVADEGADGDAAVTAAADEAQAFDDQPGEDVPPATAADLLPIPPAEGGGVARMDGYGPLRIGMTSDEMKQAWDGEDALSSGGLPAGAACHYLFPGDDIGDAPVAFMVEDGRFVRYDARDAGLEAPGGGRIGMPADEVRAMHAGRIEARPHKYVEGGLYLRVTDGTGQGGVLVFEVDADGRVTGWHAGQAPQVDYVEGCS